MKHLILVVTETWKCISESFNTIYNKRNQEVYHILQLILVITVPADVPAPKGQQHTLLTAKVDMFISKFLWLSMISYHLHGSDDVIQMAEEILRNLDLSC